MYDKGDCIISDMGKMHTEWAKRFPHHSNARADCEKLKRRAADTERVYEWPATEQLVNGRFQS